MTETNNTPTPPLTETRKYYSKRDGNVLTLYDIETNKKVGWFDGLWHSPTVEPTERKCLCGKGILAVQEPAVHTEKRCGPLDGFISDAVTKALAEQKARMVEVVAGKLVELEQTNKHVDPTSVWVNMQVIASLRQFIKALSK